MLAYLLSSDVIPNGVRSGSLIIIFILSVFFDRSVWLGMDYLISFITGLALFIVPQHLLQFQIFGTLDSHHYILARALGVVILSNVLYCYLVSNSRDGTVHISYLSSKSASLCLMLLAGAHAVYGTKATSKPRLTDEQFLSFSGLACLLSLLGNIYHLALSKDYSSFPNYHIRFHMHLRLDFLISCTRAIAIYAFPIMAMKALNVKQDVVSHTLLRFIASEDILASLISLQAGTFLYEREKTIKMYCRIQSSITQILFFSYVCFFSNLNVSHSVFYLYCGLNILLILNAAFSLTESAMLIHDYRSPSKNGKDDNIDHSWFEARKTPEKVTKQLFT
ncbi:DgyrCDS2748 [Dimorphilus gyrociliatus]|uniref:DgyrCDS2748 n=1 Tax=Dimorphilus gyrociliatus TaxID=2664684 RepID=A0A7I8VB72_9ANNE|nr:DgyrCDS2748 [Dimorphilus gyrociliatus]